MIEIRKSKDDKEYIALVGANGEDLLVSETYEAGHGSAQRAAENLRDRLLEGSIVTIADRRWKDSDDTSAEEPLQDGETPGQAA